MTKTTVQKVRESGRNFRIKNGFDFSYVFLDVVYPILSNNTYSKHVN